MRAASFTTVNSCMSALCARSPKTEYKLCIAYANEVRQASVLGTDGVVLADNIRFGHYAYKGEQMYRVMQGYKNADDPSVGEYQKDIKYIAADALVVHYPCIAKIAGSIPIAWATIPSTRSSRNYGKPPYIDQAGYFVHGPNGNPATPVAGKMRRRRTTISIHGFSPWQQNHNSRISHMFC